MMFRLMSPQPPYVFEPTLAIAAITVFRLPLSTPCSWKAWRVVARRSPWPYLFDRSSSSLYTAGGISPHGTLRRSMNWYDFCFSFPLSIRFCCMYEPWCLRMWIESFETKISSSPMSVSSGSRSPFEAAFTTWTVSCVSRLVHGRPPGAGCAGAVGPTVCVSSAGTERARARERWAKGRGPGEWRRNCAARAAGCIAGERTEPKVGRRGRRRHVNRALHDRPPCTELVRVHGGRGRQQQCISRVHRAAAKRLRRSPRAQPKVALERVSIEVRRRCRARTGVTALALPRNMTQATLLAAALLASYSYYTAWVVLTPFVDRDVSWFHDIFPDRYYALAVPTALMVAAVAFVFGFVGIVHLRGGDGES